MWNVWLIFHQRHSLEHSQISPQWRKAFSNIKVWLQSRWYEGKPSSRQNYVPNLNNSKATEHPISIRKGHLVTTSYRKNPTHFEMPWQIWNCLKNKCRRFQVKTNATSVTLHRLRQATWGHIWKRTVEKSQSNAFVVHIWIVKGRRTKNIDIGQQNHQKEKIQADTLWNVWLIFFQCHSLEQSQPSP